ncbi:replicative DNA helicase [Hymenobacter crusticola]|uniref:Replicative DNA helicase n=1 Tax=Hymenobacter crusticola TaxID=1770526 RepID=A0A243W6E6_9BACT|nr:replicative DNA helicase [Hymenobacter crusticola]OUJ69924.1 replicative DNA helicase [Hymenobacter crusticola]
MNPQPYTHVAPHDDNLEKAVLGAMLLEVAGLRTGLTLLRSNEEVFYQPAHRLVFRAIERLFNAGQAVDLISINRQLDHDGTLTRAGGSAEVAELSVRVHSAAHLPTHCLQLLELYTKRKVAEIGRQLVDRAYDLTQDSLALLGQAQQKLNCVHDVLQIRRPQTVGELYLESITAIANATQQRGGLTGVPSGLTSLDKVTGGFQPSDLIIIAARPGMGKTSLALSIARHAAGQGIPGLFLTLEMDNAQLMRKLIATEAGYTTSQLQRGLLEHGLAEVESIQRKTTVLTSLPLYLDDTPSLSISEARAKASRMKADHQIGFIITDYLQLMQDESKNQRSREQEISAISRGLKMLAKELNIPIIALSQLSRDVEKRGGDKRPQLSDLRESGAIEQDADVIIFPYRPEYYGILEDALGVSTRDTTELIIAKHRNGGLDSPVVKSVMSQGQYGDLDLGVVQ